MPSRSTPSPTESSAPSGQSRWWIVGLIAVVALLAGHFARGLKRPWSEEDNWYGAVYAQAAHNNLRAGMHAAGVPATLYFGPLPVPPEAYYVHHPTLLPVLVTASFAVFGEAEWSTRLVPVAASMVSVMVLWLLLRAAAGPRAATFGAAVFAAVPMELHYGDMVDFEPVLTCWMLCLLACLWHWQKDPSSRVWAAGIISCTALTLWTDWPGYLLVLSLAAYFIFRAPRDQRWMGWLLGALVGFAGMLFLLQIRWANTAAWSDLWSALQMRLGNAIPTSTEPIAANAPHFTWGDWTSTVLGDLRGNYLLLTWLCVAAGAGHIVIQRRSNPGVRWLGWAATHLTVAGTLYVVLLRNESFIHDFAPFYLIGAIAILAGLGLDALCRFADTLAPAARGCVQVLALGVVLALAYRGPRRSEEMRSPYLILDGAHTEPAELIPELGRKIGSVFPPNTTLLANFDPYGSALTYYSQHPILTNLLTVSDWQASIARENPAGGIIWLDAPGAKELLASLHGPTTPIEIAGIPFVIWLAPTVHPPSLPETHS